MSNRFLALPWAVAVAVVLACSACVSHPAMSVGPGDGTSATIAPGFGARISGWNTASTTFPAIAGQAAAIAGNTLYVAGGRTSDATFAAGPWIAALAPSGMAFTRAGTLPTPVEGAVLLSDAAGRLHLISGTSDLSSTTCASGSWTSTDGATYVPDGPAGAGVPFPAAVRDAAGAALGNHLYVLGGRPSRTDGPQATLYVGDASRGTPTWSSSPGGLPGPRRSGGAIALQVPDATGKATRPYLYLLGGDDGAQAHGEVYVAALDPTTGAVGNWTPTTSLPQPLCFMLTVGATASATIGGVASQSAFVYAVGGLMGQQPGAVVTGRSWVAQVNADGSLGRWTATTDLPQPMEVQAGGIDARRRLWVVGGVSATMTDLTTVYEGDPGAP